MYVLFGGGGFKNSVYPLRDQKILWHQMMWNCETDRILVLAYPLSILGVGACLTLLLVLSLHNIMGATAVWTDGSTNNVRNTVISVFTVPIFVTVRTTQYSIHYAYRGARVTVQIALPLSCLGHLMFRQSGTTLHHALWRPIITIEAGLKADNVAASIRKSYGSAQPILH